MGHFKREHDSNLVALDHLVYLTRSLEAPCEKFAYALLVDEDEAR